LAVDVLNIADGNWSALEAIKTERLAEGWERVSAGLKVKVPNERAHSVLVERSIQEQMRPVEIVDVKILSKRGGGSVLRENDAFKIRVELKRNEPVDTLNVSVNIFRSDGVYVFYQATCLDRVIRGSDQIDFVEFEFDPNPFGAGDFEVNTFATNSFSMDQGPPTDIYDKHIGQRLTIVMSRPFAFGLVNAHVPVTFLAKDDVLAAQENTL
jgi:hypothetical protein